VLIEQDEAALQRGRERVAEHYRQRVAAGKLDAARASAAEGRLSTSMEWAALATADLVIEAVFEIWPSSRRSSAASTHTRGRAPCSPPTRRTWTSMPSRKQRRARRTCSVCTSSALPTS
jgi:hypothetical protein